MGDLQSHLFELEGKLEERVAKVESFTAVRETDQREGQRLSVRLSVERAQLANSMFEMRTNPSSCGSHVLELPPDRRQAKDRELKAIFDRVDPNVAGHISLPSLKRTMGKLLPAHKPPDQRGRRPKQVTRSLSSSSLITAEQRKTMSTHDQCMEAFKACDTDGSGTISKRELLTALKMVGLKDTKTAIDIFQGFDIDGDGELTFDEFFQIALKVLI